MIRAYIGSGGKTTLIKKQAEEFRLQGKKVFVTTSTKMYIEEDALITDDADEIINVLNEKGYVIAGQSNGEKMISLSSETYQKVCAYADEVLIEADGSKHMPIKFPNETEPVIYQNVDEIVLVVGLHALDNQFKEVSHRLELVKKCLLVKDEDYVNASHIMKLLQKGYLEKLKEEYPDKNIVIEPTEADTLYKRVVAALLKAEMEVSLVEKDWFNTQPHLIVCGGGHVATELVNIASFLDFYIKVIDDREEFASKERFPNVNEVICDSFENIEKYIDEDDYYAIVTRGHKNDYVCLEAVLKHKYQYLGMIGSKSKVQNNFEKLREAGVSEEQIATIHAPIGLKIGAITPAEIAISILAEIIQEKNKTHQSSASKELLEVKEAGTLCIIIEKKGSAPRGVGSMMFVGDKGIIGSVGGGAVEYQAIEDAKGITKPMIKEYGLSEGDVSRLGMICGGRNKILFVPI